MMDFKEYCDSYHASGDRRLPDGFCDRKGKLNQKQLQKCYGRYVVKMSHRKDKARDSRKPDERWDSLKAQLPKGCQFKARLVELGEKELVESLEFHAHGLDATIDMAHVFPRGGYPWMKYERKNVVSLNRWSHSNLDTMRDPIVGDPISKEEVEGWWRVIIGDDLYDELGKMSLWKNRKDGGKQDG